MMKQPFHVVAQMVLGNPLVELTLSALPEPIRGELQELRRMVLAGELTMRSRERHEGDVDGEKVRGVGICQGAVHSGSVRGVNLLLGDVHGGTVRGVNVIRGAVTGGSLTAVNLLLGTVRGGSLRAFNAVVGDIHGGELAKTNLVVGHVHGGTVETHLLVGDIYGGEVSASTHLGTRRTGDADRDGPGAPSDTSGDASAVAQDTDAAGEKTPPNRGSEDTAPERREGAGGDTDADSGRDSEQA
jgi:hypothetical protein